MSVTNSNGKSGNYYYNSTLGGILYGTINGKPGGPYWFDPYGNVTMRQQMISNVVGKNGQQILTYQRSSPLNKYMTQFKQTRNLGANGKPVGNWFTFSTSVVKNGKIISQQHIKKGANGVYHTGNGWVASISPAKQLTVKDLYSPVLIKAMAGTTNITPATRVSLIGGNVYLQGVKNKAGKNINMQAYWWWSNYYSVQGGVGKYYGGTQATAGNVVTLQSAAWRNGKLTYVTSGTITGGSEVATYTYHNVNGRRIASYNQARFNPNTGALTTRSGGYGVPASQRAFKQKNLLPAGVTVVGKKLLAGNQASSGTSGSVYLYSNGAVISTTSSGIMKVSPIQGGKSTVTIYSTRNGNVPVTATMTYNKANIPVSLSGVRANGNKFTIKFDGKGSPLSMVVTNVAGTVTSYTATATGWRNNTNGVVTAYSLAKNRFASSALQIGYISRANVVGPVLSSQAQMNTPFSRVLLFIYDQVQGTLGKVIALFGFIAGAFMLIGGYPRAAVAAAFTVGVFMAFGPMVLNLIFGSAM